MRQRNKEKSEKILLHIMSNDDRETREWLLQRRHDIIMSDVDLCALTGVDIMLNDIEIKYYNELRKYRVNANGKVKRIPPHLWMTKEEYKEYKKAMYDVQKEKKKSKLEVFNAMTDAELLDFCSGCYKSCPCEGGEIRDRIMKERGLIK